MSDQQPIPEFHSLLKARNDEAVRLVVGMFDRRLRGLASAQMPPAVKVKEEPEDVVQSVFKSFFRGLDSGVVDRVDDLDDVWAILATITVRKAHRRNRKWLFTKKTCVNRELTADREDANADPVGRLFGREPAPEEAVMLVDLVQWMLGKITDEVARKVVVMWLQDYRPAEIATATGRSVETVFRIQRKVREAMKRKFAEADPPSPPAEPAS
jgi:RNA polymerase sigma-70 factor (ECF subfamily)